ncbi:MAG: hypothetical protein U0K57_05960 [Lachnospiraceae bacterium]|nr:hypothetical protein [Lachnospiraceae bacterium]
MRRSIGKISAMLFAGVVMAGMSTGVSAAVAPGFTGVSDLQYYENGQPSNKSGWVTYGKNHYYLNNGRAVTGWYTLPSFAGGKKTYRYYFGKKGNVSTDLYRTFGTTWMKKKLKVYVNLTTHNINLMAYNKQAKKYNIPVRAWVCSTARDGHSTRVGNYHLSRSSASSWFIYKRSNPHHYYQYKVKIHGTNMLFHSEMYRGTSKKKLLAYTYNGLGTNQSTRCIRQQCGNAYLLYRTAKVNKHSIPVKIYRSSDKGAFGVRTIQNSGGKISRKQRWDPTDPKFKNRKGSKWKEM